MTIKEDVQKKQVSPAATGQSSEPLGVGNVLKGRYILESWLGSGGMGVVYSARDLGQSDQRVAVKILNQAFAQDPKYMLALQELVRHLQSIHCPMLLEIKRLETDANGLAFMIMEYISGRPLSHFIGQPGFPTLPQHRSLQLIAKIAEGLAAAHRAGVIHGDLKPGNVLVTRNFDIKIIDFGLSAALHLPWGSDESELTRFDVSHLGAFTPAYASYAVLMGSRPSETDDLYALACLGYELFTGRHPYGKANAVKAKSLQLFLKPIPELPRPIWRLLEKHLAFSAKGHSNSGSAASSFATVCRKSLREKWTIRFGRVLKKVALGTTALSLFISAGWGTYRFLGGSLHGFLQEEKRPKENAMFRRSVRLIPLNFGVNFTPRTTEEMRGLYVSWVVSALKNQTYDQAMKWVEEGLQLFPVDPELALLKQSAMVALGEQHIERAYLNSAELPPLDWEDSSQSARQEVMNKRLAILKASPELGSSPAPLVKASLPLAIDDSKKADPSRGEEVQPPLKPEKKKTSSLARQIAVDPCEGKTSCFDKLAPEIRGPQLTVLPLVKGDQVMTRYPITIRDFNYYCRLSHQCEERHSEEAQLSSILQDVGSVVGNYNAFCRQTGQCEGIADSIEYEPITDLEVQERASYLKWLHERTGHVYRLPTASEWQHALEGAGAYPCAPLKDQEYQIRFALENSFGFAYFPDFNEWFKSPEGSKQLRVQTIFKGRNLHCVLKRVEKGNFLNAQAGFHLVRE